MPAGARKHGLHRYTLLVPASAAGTATDDGAVFAYDAFADQFSVASTAAESGYVFPYDLTSEQLVEASWSVNANFTGQATNFVTISLAHVRAGSIQNELRVAFSAAGNTMTAYRPISFNVASGGTLPNAGTATLTVQTGTTLPWTLVQGDVVVLRRLSTGTGQATTNISGTLIVRQFGA